MCFCNVHTSVNGLGHYCRHSLHLLLKQTFVSPILIQGKEKRISHIFGHDGRALVVALDHAGIAGPLPGLENARLAVERMSEGGADALLVTRGTLRVSANTLSPRTGTILRISGVFTLLTDPAGFKERNISSVEAAIRYGADAVAVTIKFGHESEGKFIEQASKISDSCQEWGMPLMIEVMLRGERLGVLGEGAALAIAARSAFELGADFLKIPVPFLTDDLERVADTSPVPILIMGGEKKETVYDVFDLVSKAIASGCSGVAMGRNIWADAKGTTVLGALRGLIHEDWTVPDAVKFYNAGKV